MEERFSTDSAGLLLGKLGLLVLITGFLVAAWAGMFILALILGIAVASGVLTKLWSRYSLSRVSCNRILSETRVFPGESIELMLQLSNRKFLPLPWVQVEDEIPVGFYSDITVVPENRLGYGLLSKAASLLWYSRISWTTVLNCTKRGYYKLGPVCITSGDVFGINTRSRKETAIDNVIVYPKIISVDDPGLPSSYPLGSANTDRIIFEDPLRVMGVRDYRPQDSMRKIHWKATARQQLLQVKVLEPSTTLEAAVFFSVDSFMCDNRSDDEFEYGISFAASIAKYLLERSNPTGIFINSKLADSDQPARILPGTSRQQLVAILEALAKTTKRFSQPFDQFLNRECRYLPWGTTVILVVYELSDSLKSLLVHLKSSGYKTHVYEIGRMNGNSSKNNISHITEAAGS